MKLLTYQYQGVCRSGALMDHQHVVDLHLAYQAALHDRHEEDERGGTDSWVPTDLCCLLQGGEVSLNAAKESLAFVQERLETHHLEQLIAQGLCYPLDQVSFQSPVLHPSKVMGLVLNYPNHVAEWGTALPHYPILFHKTPNSLTGHGHPIRLPLLPAQVDFEAELAIIIGKRGQYIPEAQAFSYIAGYACANDVNTRTLEGREEPWTDGVMFETFCPLGPILVTRDEVPNPHALSIKSFLNGQLLQNANTAEMHFRVPYIVSYISSRVTLEPGDVILTGTPAGVGFFQQPPRFLKDKDIVTVEIENLGRLTNPVVSP